MPSISKDAVLEQLDRIIEQVPEMTMDSAVSAMSKAMAYMHEQIPQYPDKLENQVYRRTLTLGKTLADRTEDVVRGVGTVTGKLGTKVPYAPWVIGPDYPGEDLGGGLQYQAKIHQGRWWQLGDIYDDNVDGAWLLFDKEFWADLKKRFAEAR